MIYIFALIKPKLVKLSSIFGVSIN